MKALSFLFLMLLSFPLSAETVFSELKKSAETLFLEKSFSKAKALYESALKQKLPPREERWVKFRIADCGWRAAAGSETTDSTPFDQAFQALNVLVRDAARPEDKDRVWAEVQESLGDFYWTRTNMKNWGGAWPYYQNALDFWAGDRDMDLARERYLRMVWTVARPAWAEPYYYYGYYGNTLPADILENVLKIAQTEEDKAHANYLLAMSTRYYGGDWNQQQRTLEAFEAAIQFGKKSEWYDDALYHYGEQLMSLGKIRRLENGSMITEPDYVKALAVFQKLMKEFSKGETSYFDQAKSQADSITAPSLGVSLSNVFLPESEIQYYLSWRNLDRVDLALYPIDLPKDVNFKNSNNGAYNWLQEVDLGGRKKIQAWSKEVQNAAHVPGQEMLRLDKKLAPGAYVLEARGGGKSARDLILVSDSVLVTKTSRKQMLVYFCNAQNGAPIPEAFVKLWERYYDGQSYRWRTHEKNTDSQGLICFGLEELKNTNTEFFVGASSKNGASQAFVTGNGPYYYGNGVEKSWKIYAFTDRPAYRPGEEAQFKWLARTHDGKVYHTPSKQTLEYEINDPQGVKVKEGKSTLNEFGSGWDSLKLDEKMPLGEYRITFFDSGRSQTLGGAVLFRLEEYKLPEFRVSVSTPEEKGRKKVFRLGEKVEAEIQTDYFFGGPVANATVEVLVTQTPYYQYWYPFHDYGWYYEDLCPRWNPAYYGGGQIVKRETLKTDATGKITVTFDTPINSGQDFSYSIEARVTDSSRREITGTTNLKVTRQSYAVHLYADHYLYHPQDKVGIRVKTLDPNDVPLSIEGIVKLSRDRWQEIWVTPEGKEMKGTPQAGWTLKSQGFEHEELQTLSLKTNDQGEAEYSFTPEREGYYRVSWTSQEKDGSPINTETTVWVATNSSTDLGYRYGGLQIIADRDTFHAGRKSPVMLCAPSSDRYVLFSTETEDILQYQLVHMTGPVKLLELDIREEHVPNVFLSASMVQDLQLLLDTKQVIVPPEENFLNVKITSDQNAYLPREKGDFKIWVTDQNGKPVSGELALGVVDESVYSIQEDYAGDPRQFYYGTKRNHGVQTLSTFQYKGFAQLVLGRDSQLVNRRYDRQAQNAPMSQTLCDSLAVGAKCKEEGYREKDSRDETRAVGGMLSELKKSVSKSDMPASAPAPLMEASAPPPGGNGGALPDESAVQVRSDFRSTLFWQPDLKTDAEGQASVSVPFADSLTTWKGTCRVNTAQNRFGIAMLSVQTRQPLIARLQAPRFFVVGDLTTVSVVMNNNTEEALPVLPGIQAEGLTVTGFLKDGKPVKGELSSVSVPPHGEARVDWVVSAQKAGEAKIKVLARHEKYSDGMEKAYPVIEHGIEQFLCKSGKTRNADTSISLTIPAERKKESTAMSLQISPSLAVTMLDALPYLIDYPYGCTEQTLSRFLPAVIVSRTLKDLGLKPEDIESKIFGGIEKDFAGKTHPKGSKSLTLLPDIIQKSLERLYDFQQSDGGWGWWKEGTSDHYMSAYVLWGLSLAQSAQTDVRSGCLESAAKYLDLELVEEESSLDMQSWMLHALAGYHKLKDKPMSGFQKKAFKNLYSQREKLNAYSRALLALSAWHFGLKTEAQTLIANLENGVKLDAAPDTSAVQKGLQQNTPETQGTAHWGSDGIYWHWSEGGVEATAFALQALLTMDPKNKLVEPVTNWLLKNRRGAQWSNTKDTALVILSMMDYLKTSGELNASIEYELQVNGKTISTQKITPQDVLKAPSVFTVDPTLIQDGENTIRLLKKGEGALYFSAQAVFFNQQEPIPSAGHEIFARRQYYKIVGRPTLLKGYVYEKIPLKDGDSLKSGERVETVLTIEAKNNYEYLLFEDLKPAGFEAAEIKSGEPIFARELKSGTLAVHLDLDKLSSEQDYTGQSRSLYQELRDRKTAFFVDKLPQGLWEIRYELRAEVPGTFHALPLLGHAMYVPEIRCNSDETRVNVLDA